MNDAAANDPGFAPADELRPKAERPVNETANSLETMSEADLRALIGELRLRQNDLQAENETLRDAHDNVARQFGRYDHLFNAAPLGYFVLDQEGCILEMNRAAAEVLNAGREDLLKKPLKPLLAADERFAFATFLDLLLHGDGKKQSGKFVLLRDGEEVPVLMVGMAARARRGGSRDNAASPLSTSTTA